MYQEGFDVVTGEEEAQEEYTQSNQSLQRKSHQGLGKLRKEGVGSHSANREWEVGKKTNYDEVDDGRSLEVFSIDCLMYLSYNRKSNGDF